MEKRTVTQAYPFHILDTTLIKYRGNDPEVTIPAGVTKIADYAFLAVNTVRRVKIPNTVKEIGLCAFQACKNLEEVELPSGLEVLAGAVFVGCDRLKKLEFPQQLSVVPLHLCRDCKSLEKVTLPRKAERIEWRAFYGCTGLREVELPPQLQRIGEEAFSQCTALETVIFPDSVTCVDSKVFAGCKMLKKIRLSQNLMVIPDGAFNQCSIQTITIPDKVSRIDFTAFQNCEHLDLIVIDAERPSITNYGSSEHSANCTEAPVFFSKPREMPSVMRRNMIRGYARMKLAKKTTPEQERSYEQYVKAQIRYAGQVALTDTPLMQYLLQERLIPLPLAKELLDMCLQKQKNEKAAILLNYIGKLRSAADPFDPTDISI